MNFVRRMFQLALFLWMVLWTHRTRRALKPFAKISYEIDAEDRLCMAWYGPDWHAAIFVSRHIAESGWRFTCLRQCAESRVSINGCGGLATTHAIRTAWAARHTIEAQIFGTN